jgi:translation initiation factor 6 (eIF-6)
LNQTKEEKQESTEDNAIELEATQQKVTSNVDASNDDQLPISRSLTKHISESVDDVLQLETKGNAFGKVDECEKTEASNKK